MALVPLTAGRHAVERTLRRRNDDVINRPVAAPILLHAIIKVAIPPDSDFLTLRELVRRRLLLDSRV